ncbi:MAG: hypothetical protein MUE98_00565 [Rhodobacteraceae bacterium]|jgi:hypothetical protein|nr:hypothetical protein [Paracoccaceae bacterium]
MPELLKETEAVPAAWPDAPAGLSAAAAALDAVPLWQRIEAWCRFRWTPREVVWIVEGMGEWTPPLAPATVTLAEGWTGAVWGAVTLLPGPCGLFLPTDDPCRITATVGGGDVPPAVLEAFRRLAEYSAEIGKYGQWRGPAGATSSDFNLSEGLSHSVDRPATWAARALINSGAADLLRPYRRTA